MSSPFGQALTLAKTRRGFCAPNPAVGAVLIKEGNIISTGTHWAAGDDHAEVVAIKKAGKLAKDATLYVTLEPCSHFGKTPPCTDAIIKAGIKQVVYAYCDPNPVVHDKSKEILKAAGIRCDYEPDNEIAAFYRSYTYWVKNSRPYVTGKLALSLDNKIAGQNNTPLAVTGADLKIFTHNKRLQADAILTTAKTIHADNPQMNVRLGDLIIPKAIFIIDSSGSLDLNSQVLTTAKSITILHSKRISTERLQAFSEHHIRCIEIAEINNKLDLHKICEILGKEGFHDVWLEAGSQCFEAFANEGLLQRAFFYIAPKLLGKTATQGLSSDKDYLDTASHFSWHPVGDDVALEVQW